MRFYEAPRSPLGQRLVRIAREYHFVFKDEINWFDEDGYMSAERAHLLDLTGVIAEVETAYAAERGELRPDQTLDVCAGSATNGCFRIVDEDDVHCPICAGVIARNEGLQLQLDHQKGVRSRLEKLRQEAAALDG